MVIFRNLVTPDMLTLIKVSAALCSEIWKILYKLGYRMNLVDLHDHQIIYDNITSIPAERMWFSAYLGHWMYFGLSSNPP